MRRVGQLRDLAPSLPEHCCLGRISTGLSRSFLFPLSPPLQLPTRRASFLLLFERTHTRWKASRKDREVRPGRVGELYTRMSGQGESHNVVIYCRAGIVAG